MARKLTEETVDDVAVETAPVQTEPVNKSGFWCYIGPNVKNLIQTGTVYRGTRAEALKQAEKVIQERPEAAALIVSGDALPSARIRVRKPGNALYAKYKAMAGKEGK